MAQLRAVFWDVDGTLADTEMDGHRPAFNAAFAELGLPIVWDPKLYSELLSIPGGLRRVRIHAAQLGLSISEPQLLELRDRKRFHYLQRVRDGHVGWRPGVLRLLHELHDNGIEQWVVTSSGKASVSALLDAGRDERPTFNGIVSSDDVLQGKPAPDGYLRALQLSCCDPENVLAIEDSAAGLQAACAASIRCVLTPSPWDADLKPLLSKAAAAFDHLGEPSQPAAVLSGPPCPRRHVTLEYLKSLLAELAR